MESRNPRVYIKRTSANPARLGPASLCIMNTRSCLVVSSRSRIASCLAGASGRLEGLSHAFLCLQVLAGVVAMAAAQGYGGGGGSGGGGGGGGRFIPIVKDDHTQNAYGENTFEFEAANGIVRYESGKENNGHVQEGGWR